MSPLLVFILINLIQSSPEFLARCFQFPVISEKFECLDPNSAVSMCISFIQLQSALILLPISSEMSLVHTTSVFIYMAV